MPMTWHTSCQIGSEVILYSGLTKDYSEKTKQRLASAVDVFDMYTELWQRKKVTGEGPAPGAYSAASASVADDLFMFGGNDGRRFYNSLHRLKGGSKWTQVCPQNERAESPMAKYGAGMVAFGDNLAVLGGYGVPHGLTQPGSSFIGDMHTQRVEKCIGLTNEFHIFSINDGVYKRYLTR